MLRCLRLAFALLLVLLPASLAQAEILLADFQYTGTVPDPGGLPEFRPLMAYGNPTQPGAAGFIQADAMTLLHFANGTRLDLVGDFSTFKALAADGVDQKIYLGFEIVDVGYIFTLQDESMLLASAYSLAPNVGSPDFAGYELTRVEVLGVAYAPAAGDQLELTFLYSVYGTVPEPGSLVMLAVGGVALVAGYRSRRRR